MLREFGESDRRRPPRWAQYLIGAIATLVMLVIALSAVGAAGHVQ